MRTRQYLPLVLATAVAAGVLATRTPPATAQAGQTQPEPAARMRGHYGQALVLHAAVIRGDLPAVAAPAKSLAEDSGPSSLPAGSARHVEAIKAAARRAAAAKDVLAAAAATSAMLTSCGECHRAAGTMPAAPLASPPVVGGIVGHMLQHQQAADQMLQGLMRPSNALWQEGARSFLKAPLHPQDLPVDTAARKQMVATEERLHRTASQAVEATEPLARANLYAMILAGCADCHREHPKVWGPWRGISHPQE